MSQNPPTCPLCELPAKYAEREPNRQVLHFGCDRCGEYAITRRGQALVQYYTAANWRYLLSGVTRNATEAGEELEIASDAEELASRAPSSRNPIRHLERLLLLIADRTTTFSEPALLSFNDYPLFYLRNHKELATLIGHLSQLDLVSTWEEAPPHWTVKLSPRGWQRVEDLRSSSVQSQQVFVAMWFDPSVQHAWTKGISPAVLATGFSPIRVDAVEHNEKIDDRIVTEIRRSRFIVADFTGNRGGVYFEAGFALGLGLPVIWSCREDQIGSTHFDTRQYNHVTWSSPDELRTKLIARIRATIPGAQLFGDEHSATGA